MKKSYSGSALFLAAVLVLSACGNNNNNAANSPSPGAGATSGAPAAGGGETKELTINATNFAFDQNDIQFNVGDTVKLTLHNENGNHGLAIPDLDVNLQNGETAELTFDQAGTYEFHCSIQCGQGHDEMVGKITVS